MATETKKRNISTPPAGYVCKICSVEGHWIQQCPQKSKSKKRKTSHIPVPGVDPSQTDIDLAREYQKIKPPPCFCGNPSRIKKVKKSNVNENSRAVGKYFFFCASKKSDSPCRFARPVKEHRQRKQGKKEPAKKVEGKSAETDESNPTTTMLKTIESEGPSAPEGDSGGIDSGSNKESIETKSTPQVSDGSKNSDSSSDSSSDDSSDSSSDSSDEE